MASDVAIVLTLVDGELTTAESQVRNDIASAQRTAASLDDVIGRARRLAAASDVVASGEVRPTEDEPAAAPDDPPGPTWDALVDLARETLRQRGVEPDGLELGALLDPDEVAVIEDRFRGDFVLKAALDRYDVVAAICAGLVSALCDFLVVRIPQDTLARKHGLRDQFFDRGSPLTKWMQERSLPHDNPLSALCKTPYDRVNLKHTGRDLPGSGGRTHRFHSTGHDPLLGLAFGTLDILTGALTGIGSDGVPVRIPGTGPSPTSNPLEALAIQVMHTLSDAFTCMGVPAPGWTAAGGLQFGSIGEHGLTIGQTARQMYVAGYDSRHFLTMATAPAAAEATLRAYWGIRRYFDIDFTEATDHQALVAGARRTSEHPRFQALSLTAHGIAAAANAGKVACYGAAGPLALNYAQWLAFIRALFMSGRTRLRDPNDVLTGHARANAEVIAGGWPEMRLSAEAPTLT